MPWECRLYHPQDQPGTNNYVDGVFGVLARNDAKGGITVSDLSVNNSKISSSSGCNPSIGTFIKNQSRGTFTFNF